MEFIQTIGKLIVRYHSFFEEGIVNTLIIAAFTVFFGTIFGTLTLNLQSGAEYHFEIEANTISDTSDAKNIMGKTKLDTFKTIFAVVNLSNPNESTLEGTITDYHDPGQFVAVVL